MDTDVFLNIYGPYLKVIFNGHKFLQDQTAAVGISRFERSQYGRFLNPWYVNRRGCAVDYADSEGDPIPVAEALQKLDRVGHAEHLTKVAALIKLTKGDHAKVYDPVMPVVGFDRKQTYFIFDGNHRLCAAHELSLPEIYFVFVESDIMKDLSEDFRCHS